MIAPSVVTAATRILRIIDRRSGRATCYRSVAPRDAN